MRAKFPLFIVSMLVTITLISCGGGNTTVAEGGIGGTGISMGAVTGFGSIYVNGVKYDTTNTLFTSNGATEADQSHLSKGMVVVVRGDINSDSINGVANSVDYKYIVDAKISALTTNSFTALNQTIHHDGSMTLTDGSRYQVSGYYDHTGEIHASFIAPDTSIFASPISIRGWVTSVSSGTFNIGDLIVTPATGISLDNVKVGDFVGVSGTYNDTETLTATRAAEVESLGLGISDLSDAELEGYILESSCTTVTALPCEVSLNGQPVEITSSTSFDAGSYLDVVAGTEVEVEGSIVNGVLIADEIEFKNEVEIEVEVSSTIVEDITIGKKILTATGLAGLEIVISNDGSTEFGSNTTYTNPTLDGTITHLAIQGKMVSGQLIAQQMEAGSAPNIKLHAAVDSFVPNISITLAGQTILTSGLQIIIDDNTVAGKSITETELYEYLAKNNVIIEFRGVLNLATITWQDIELDL